MEKDSKKKKTENKYIRTDMKEADFDGHTEFDSMTFEQKLTWLSESAESMHIIRQSQIQKSKLSS